MQKHFDQLETRRLMSVSVNVDANGVLNITGTDANELVYVNEGGSYFDDAGEHDLTNRAMVAVAEYASLDEFGNPLDADGNFVDLQWVFDASSAPLVSGIKINTNGGNDTIAFSTLNVPATINSGAGDDIVTVGIGADGINARATHTDVNTGDGNDTVTLAAASNVSLLTGAGNDSVLLSDGDGTPVINAGDGNDSVIATGGHAGYVTGGAGNDTIQFIGTGVRIVDGVRLANGFGGFADGGTGDDSFTVLDSNAIVLFGGNGSDVFVNQNGTAILMSGDNGNDSFFVNDPSATGLILGGNGSDFFYINSPTYLVDGGAGKDTAQVTTTASGSAIVVAEKIVIVSPTTQSV